MGSAVFATHQVGIRQGRPNPRESQVMSSAQTETRSEVAAFHSQARQQAAWKGDGYLRRAAGMVELSYARAAGFLRTWPRDACVLPLNPEPPLRSYLDAAYYTGIITAAAPLRGALLHYYVQLFFPFAKLTKRGRLARMVTLPFLRLQDFRALGYFSSRQIEYKTTEPARLLELMQSALREGNYLLTNVDEFYITDTAYFRRSHFRHAHLVVGFDGRRRIFRSAVYRRDGTFGVVGVPGEFFLRGLLRAHELGGGKPQIEAVRVGGAEPASFSPALLRRQLIDYLAGNDNSADYMGGPFSVPGVKPWNEVTEGYFGVNIYTGFRYYLQTLIGQKYPIDLRASRMLFEHKQVLGLALEVAPVAAGAARAAREFKEIAALAQRIHLKAFAYNKTLESEIIYGMLDMLLTLHRTEVLAIQALLDSGYGASRRLNPT